MTILDRFSSLLIMILFPLIPEVLSGYINNIKNIWVLKLDSNWETVYSSDIMLGKTRNRMQGKIEFLLTDDKGKIDADGPMIYQSETVTNLNNTSISVEGKLILKGEVKDGVVSFVPKAVMKNSKVNMGKLNSSTSDSGGICFFNAEKEVSIPVEDGIEIIQDISDTYGPMKTSGQSIWGLSIRSEQCKTT